MPAVHAGAREKRLFAATAFGLAAIAILPVWVTRFLPVLDEPNHLSAIYIWHGLADPRSPLHAFYEARFAPVSYLAHYGLAYLLAFALGVEAGHKLALCVYVLGVPCVAWLFCRNTDRSPWLALLTPSLAFSISWAHGYHPFDLALVCFLLALYAYDRFLLDGSAGSALLAAIAGVLCYLGHPFPLALLYPCALFLWLVHGANRRKLTWILASFVPSLAFLGWQSHASAVGAGSASAVLGEGFPIRDPRVWWSRVLDLPDHALNPFSGRADQGACIALLGAVGLFLALGAVSARAAGQNTEPRRFVRQRCLGLALVLFAAYLVLPEHLNEPVYMWIARGRIAPAIVFFLCLSPNVGRTSPLRLIAAGVAVCLAYLPIECARRYYAFGQYMHGMERVLAACPARDQVLTLRLGEHGDPDFDVPVFRELPSWVQIVHGGYDPMAFSRPLPFPFAIKKTLPAPFWRDHAHYRAFLDPKVYGCVLTHRQDGDTLSRDFTLARKDGPWRLYRRSTR